MGLKWRRENAKEGPGLPDSAAGCKEQKNPDA